MTFNRRTRDLNGANQEIVRTPFHSKSVFLFSAFVLVVAQISSPSMAEDYPASHLVGHARCGECHESELTTWLASPHALNSLAMIDSKHRRFNPKAEKITSSFLAANQAASKKTCMTCHDTQRIQNGKVFRLNGVSCESCHGAAGAQGDKPGWIDLHYDCDDLACDDRAYTAKEREIQRVTFLEGIGMRHPKNIYGILKACIQCHTVSNEDVVNSGHPTGRIGFEYLTWFRDDLEHESELIANEEPKSQHLDCVKFIVGQMVDLEVSLRNRGTAQTHGFATAAATRIAAAHHALRRVHAAEPIADVKSAIRLIDRVYPSLFATPEKDQHHFIDMADQISTIANRLAVRLADCNIESIETILPDPPARFVSQAGDQKTLAVRDNAPSTNLNSIDAARVEGPAVCVRCHQSEYTGWLNSTHAQGAFDELRTNPNAYVYAERLGISANQIATNSLCAECHATPRSNHHGQQNTVSGVSCESCHGPAGGSGGWLNTHSVRGFLAKNQNHAIHTDDKNRVSALRQAGMHGAQDIYELAKACYRCHVVTNEQLVARGGHKTGNFDFEWVKWFQGEVRHNFHLDQRHNALSPTNLTNARHHLGREFDARQRTAAKFVVGQMVDLEISLTNRARATTTEFSNFAAGRVAAANSRLKEINEKLELDVISRVLALVEEVEPFLFYPPIPSSPVGFQAAADEIGRTAQRFAETYKQHELSSIDELIPTSAKGSVYQP